MSNLDSAKADKKEVHHKTFKKDFPVQDAQNKIFVHCHFINVDFTKQNCQGMIFKHCKFKKTKFNRADLRKAQFHYCSIQANFEGANLLQTEFINCYSGFKYPNFKASVLENFDKKLSLLCYRGDPLSTCKALLTHYVRAPGFPNFLNCYNKFSVRKMHSAAVEALLRDWHKINTLNDVRNALPKDDVEIAYFLDSCDRLGVAEN